MKSFKEVKRKFKTEIRKILKQTKNLELDEAAFPAYAHKNPIIDYLFWERIRLAFHYAKKHSLGNRALDFGCGSGVLTYLLANNGYEVSSSDIEFSPIALIKTDIDFPSEILFIEGDIMNQQLPDNSFDVIFALDVLEHIENYRDYIQLFKRLLCNNGIVVVSGPTENLLYRLGRKLAGKRFTGDYHVMNISEIRHSFSLDFEVKTIKKLIFPFVLFEVFVAQKTSSGKL